MQITAGLRIPQRLPALQVVKTSVAVALAWVVSQLLLPGELPIFAAIAAIFVVQPSVNQSVGKAIERSLGVIGGVVIAFVIGLIFGSSTWIVLLTIVLCILLAWALRLSPGSANQIPISAMLVLSIGASTPEYSIYRILETIIGAGIALIINVAVVPPVLLAPAHDAVALLGREVADTLDRAAASLRAPQTNFQLEELLLKARLLRPMLTAAEGAITGAQESLTFNPRGAKHRNSLRADIEQYERLKALVTRSLGMTRALRDHYDDSLHLEPTVQAFSGELCRAAHDLRLLLQNPDDPAVEMVPEEEPMLTAPLVIGTPHPEHWILIGSLMEDLRRVREEIVGETD
ncbi:FUSC family protein [Cryobacterium psychrophilum]|uniref:FUSC family protein n=1 Tax=Cryobacterium psychrophilum TaxID=41988 RepID=A0A4Y8KMB2_9MICO|nr:aromatic acid exporter family protein [Cryobacterium psychrophilum]TDW31382.1 aromatic acid exporter family member 1 [Cryobacterium psychrophilum]TFD78827.1 FUSC family protein [Cryobacterium psychrophilum]